MRSSSRRSHELHLRRTFIGVHPLCGYVHYGGVPMNTHTPGPWLLCHHLQDAQKDAACPCGYVGGIWGPDQENMICEMGVQVPKGEEGVSPGRYPRAVELANARLIAAAPEFLEWAQKHAFSTHRGTLMLDIVDVIELQNIVAKATGATE